MDSSVPLESAQLHMLGDNRSNPDRDWTSFAARIGPDGCSIVAAAPPPGTRIWFLTVEDERGAIVSSQLVFESPEGTSRIAPLTRSF